MSDESGVLIEATGLRKSYDNAVAVDGIDLAVSAGEVFGLLGPNGAGKTTTILMLLGLTEPSGGEVRVGGLDPMRHPLAVKRQVGYLPDAIGFYEGLTGRENLRYTAALNEVLPPEAGDRIDDLLELVGLTEEADQAVGTYSRGMRQRLGLADVLVKDPKIVILDEPTAAIDPEGVAQMQQLIGLLAHRDGRAVLLSSHLLPQVQEVCDRMAIFVKGRIVAEGTAQELGASLADGRARFRISLDASEEVLRTVANTQFGSDQVEIEAAGHGSWTVIVPSLSAQSLFAALVNANVEVREMRDLNSELDQIYRRYFRESAETLA